MKNIFLPACAPRASRSTSEGAGPVAFDDNVDIPAALGASPVPDDTPTHPTLHKGSLASDPCGSKLTRVHQFPSPNTTSDDDQKLPAKKKRCTSKPGCKAYFDVQILDNFDDALNEDHNLHYHVDNKRNSKLPKSSMHLPSSRPSRLAQWLQLPTRLQRCRPLPISLQLMTNLPNRALPLT